MNKPSNKILLLIIAVLLLTNIGVLVYFLAYRHDGGDMKKGPTELLKEQVGFSAEQLAQYTKLRDSQRDTIRPMYESMKMVKDTLFRLVGDSSVSEERLGEITDHIATKQKSLDLLTFRHFNELRKICRPDQRVAYDSMWAQIFRRWGKPAKGKGDDKK